MKKDNWEIKKLGEVFDLHMGKTPSRNNKSYWNNGTHKWLSIADMNNIKYIVETKEKISNNAVVNCNMKIVPKNTVLMSFKLSVGKVAITKEPIFTNEAIMSFRNKSDYEISNEYLYYCLLGKDWEGENRAVMGKTLNKSTLSQNTIPIPPLPVQEAIVKELDTLHRLKELQEQQLAEYDTLAQATFHSMFGDPIENEKGWEVKKMGEVCEITSSKRIFAKEYQESGIPFYRSKEIIEKSKKLPVSLELFISKERYLEIKTSFGTPKIGDILMTAVGTIGEIWVVDTDDSFYFKDGNILWLKISKSGNSIFFKYSLSILVSEYKKRMSIGSAYNALTIVNLKNMQSILPPISLQNQFAERIEKIEAQKELVKQSIAETQTLIDYTMDKYFG